MKPLRDLPPNPLWQKSAPVVGRDGLVWLDAYHAVTLPALHQQTVDARNTKPATKPVPKPRPQAIRSKGKRR